MVGGLIVAIVGGVPQPVIQEVILQDGVLRTDGALESMRIPEGWAGISSTLVTHYSIELSYRFRKTKGKTPLLSLGLKYFRDGVSDVLENARTLFELDVELKGPNFEKRSSRDTPPLQGALDHLFLRCQASDCLSLKTFTFKDHRTAMVLFERNGVRTLFYQLDTLGDLDAVELKNIDGLDRFAPSMYCLSFVCAVETYDEHLGVAMECFQSSTWRKDFNRTKVAELVPLLNSVGGTPD